MFAGEIKSVKPNTTGVVKAKSKVNNFVCFCFPRWLPFTEFFDNRSISRELPKSRQSGVKEMSKGLMGVNVKHIAVESQLAERQTVQTEDYFQDGGNEFGCIVGG